MSRQRGIGLAEVLVSITILAIATSIAFVLYDGARRSFKIGDNLTEQQQVIRIAFDELARDLRVAGFNVNPDGDRSRPDEAIEGAFDTAIVIRADFDGDDPAAAALPETDLANLSNGSAFLSVSTGNDEIVAYVLANGDSSGVLSFDADVAPPVRNGTLETVAIDDVALVQDAPPYTLYRITLAADASLQRTPVIDNVRSLRFVYYDESENVLPAPGGTDDPDGDRRRDRAAIRRIGIELEGMTRNPDPRWNDPEDSDAGTRSHRKFTLAGDVVPDNLGMFGMKDLDAVVAPPSTPPPPALHPGHCDALYVTWTPNPPQDEVARYEIRYGTDPSALDGPEYAVESWLYLEGLHEGDDVYVSVEAVDDSGNASAPSALSNAIVENANRPETTGGLTASVDRESEVRLTWDAVTDNAPPAPPAGDPLSPEMRDADGYRIYRDGTFIKRRTSTVHTDTQVVDCREYDYHVTTVDECGLESTATATVLGKSVHTVPPGFPPAPPDNLQAFLDGAGVRVSWEPVMEDTAGGDILIDSYELCRSQIDPPNPIDYQFYCFPLIQGATEQFDPIVLLSGQTVHYVVRSRDDCPVRSAWSAPVAPSCSFAGNVVIQRPHYGDWLWGTNRIDVAVVGGSGTYDGMTLTFEHETDPPVVLPPFLPIPFDASSWSVDWVAPSADFAQGVYKIWAEVQQSGCSQHARTKVAVRN